MTDAEIMRYSDATHVPAVAELDREFGGDRWCISYEGLVAPKIPNATYIFQVRDVPGISPAEMAAKMQRVLDKHWETATRNCL